MNAHPTDKLVYEPTFTHGSVYYRCPHCRNRFFAAAVALHKSDCPEKAKGFEVCTLHFGPHHVEQAKQRAKILSDETVTAGVVSIAQIRARFPELLVPLPECESVTIGLRALIVRLLGMQTNAKSRSIVLEKEVVRGATESLRRISDEKGTVRVRLGMRMRFQSKGLPLASLQASSSLAEEATTDYGSIEEASNLTLVAFGMCEGHFDGFWLGTDLGYPEQMGENWHIMLGGEDRNYYVPLDQITNVVQVSF